MTEQDDEPELDDFAEEDSEDCSHDEGEPNFRRIPRRMRHDYGPGCGISDNDHQDENEPEVCELGWRTP